MKDYYSVETNQLLAIWLLKQCALSNTQSIKLSNRFLQRWTTKDRITTQTAEKYIRSMKPLFADGEFYPDEGKTVVVLYLANRGNRYSAPEISDVPEIDALNKIISRRKLKAQISYS